MTTAAEMTRPATTDNVGRISQVTGLCVDVSFDSDLREIIPGVEAL